MKTITLLSVAADAISALNSAMSLVMDTYEDDISDLDELHDASAMPLKGDSYLTISNLHTLVRDLYGEFPKALRTEDMDAIIDKFYIHLAEIDGTDTYDVRTAKQNASQVHTYIYDRLSTARDAIALYT